MLLLFFISGVARAAWPASSGVAGAPGELELVILRDVRAPIHYRMRTDSSAAELAPFDPSAATALGSVWKLFVYFYLAENKLHPPRYECRGEDKEEIFCCRPGGSIELDAALSRSCGLYFAPARLGISGNNWKDFWETRMRLRFGWLTHLAGLGPGSTVPILELLHTLAAIREHTESYRRLTAALERVVIDGTARGAVRKLGSTLRVKTFTWDDPRNKGRYLGGFAGWLADGSPVWGRSEGSSAQVLARWSGRIAQVSQSWNAPDTGECVAVAFFDRHPVKDVLELPTLAHAALGSLRGDFRVRFANGNQLNLHSSGELSLSDRNARGAMRITGRFRINDYVARVIDREIERTPLEAARAFGILIRTYLLQNARRVGGCYAIADSTHTQRVSPNPPSEAALRIARWSDSMVLRGTPYVRYRFRSEGSQGLSWIRAGEMARQGSYFDEILRSSYPSMQLGFAGARGAAGCERLTNVEKWIRSQERRWSAQLSGVSGFSEPARFRVCRSVSSQPYSDSANDVIYMTYSGDLEDQISAAHEYLHLAFKYHPSGMNETFIESMARALVTHNAEEGDYEIR